MTDSDPMACARCGEPHEKCTAHKRDGRPCGGKPMVGQRVCRLHGGKAPQNMKAAERRVELEKATADHRAMLGHKPGAGVVNPLEVLAQLAAEALAMKDALAARVNALSEIRDTDLKGGEQLRAEVALYERALDRSANFVNLMAKSGFEAARVKMEREQGMLVAAVLKRILDGLELSEKQRTIAGQIVPLELRRLEGQGDSR